MLQPNRVGEGDGHHHQRPQQKRLLSCRSSCVLYNPWQTRSSAHSASRIVGHHKLALLHIKQTMPGDVTSSATDDSRPVAQGAIERRLQHRHIDIGLPLKMILISAISFRPIASSIFPSSMTPAIHYPD
jgi:hypothetical protein